MEVLDEVDALEFPLTSKTGLKYREFVDEEGNVLHHFEKSGVIRNAETKKIVKGYFNQENARVMQHHGSELRKRRAVDAARAGLLRGVSATELVKDWDLAWEYVVAAQAELAMTPDMGSSSTKAAEFIAKMADLDPTKQRENITLSDGKNVINMRDVPSDRLDYLLQRLSGLEEYDEDDTD